MYGVFEEIGEHGRGGRFRSPGGYWVGETWDEIGVRLDRGFGVRVELVGDRGLARKGWVEGGGWVGFEDGA